MSPWDGQGASPMTPVEAPTEILAVEVVGDALGLTAVASGDPLEPTTSLKWFIDGVLVETTRSQVYRFTLDSIAAPLALDTDYFVSAQPTNAVDDGILSPATAGRLNSGVTAESVVRAKSLVVEDSLQILDTAILQGDLELAEGTVATTAPPRAFTSWDHAAAFLLTDENMSTATLWGLYDNSTAWVTARMTAFEGYVDSIDKTTGVSTNLLGPVAGYQFWGGVAKVGTDWYVLAVRVSDATWQVRKYNSSWVFQSEWQAGDATVLALVLATDGTYLYTARKDASGFLAVDRWNLDGTGYTAVFTSAVTPGFHPAGLYVGSADFGAARYVVTAGSTAYVLNTSGTQQTTQTWAAPAGFGGLAWDGTRFHTLSAGRVYHFSTIVTATSRSITQTFYDSDATGSTHETDASPALVYSQPPRQWLRVDADPPNDQGGTDDPDSVRIYVANHLQPDLGAGVTTAVYDIPGAGGAAAPSSNGFAAVVSPGSVFSHKSDGTRINKMSGDGSGRAGDYAWDTTGKPTGWPRTPRARATRTSTQSITHDTSTALACTSELYDTASLHDTSTNNSRVLLNQIGAWTVTARIVFNTGATGQRQVVIYRNGVAVLLAFNTIGGATAFGPCAEVTETIESTAVTDYVEAFVYQDSGGALTVVGSLTVAYLGK